MLGISRLGRRHTVVVGRTLVVPGAVGPVETNHGRGGRPRPVHTILGHAMMVGVPDHAQDLLLLLLL